MDSPLVGVEQAIVQEEELEALPAKPMRTPPQMTAAEKEKHDVTHMPPHPGCPICASSRTPNLQHAASHEHLRTIPLQVGDCCFLRRIDETILATCLVMRLYPYKIFLSCIVPKKVHGSTRHQYDLEIHSGHGNYSFCLQVQQGSNPQFTFGDCYSQNWTHCKQSPCRRP